MSGKKISTSTNEVILYDDGMDAFSISANTQSQSF